MSERAYTITIRETKLVDVEYRVTAESFEEAEQKYHNGEADFYDEEHYDTIDSEIQEIECRDCGAGCEEDCDCTRADETVNPDHDKGIHPNVLTEGDWVEPDEWTYYEVDGMVRGPIKVLAIGDRDSDDEYFFAWEDADGVSEEVYIPAASRFHPADDPTLSEEERAEREAQRQQEREEREADMRVNRALGELLSV